MAGAEKKPFEPDPDRTGVGTQTNPAIAPAPVFFPICTAPAVTHLTKGKI